MSLRILLIDTDPSDSEAVRDALTNPRRCGQPFEIEWLQSCSEAMQRLAIQDCDDRINEARVDAMVIDLLLPDSCGLETFDRLFAAAPQVPILVLTGPRDEDIAKVAVQRGAQDYLLKDQVDSYVLPKLIVSMVERAAIAEALFDEKERAQVTLNSIGDAVISTDAHGRVAFLNEVAEHLTGWCLEEAIGHPFEDVFHIIDAITRADVHNPMTIAIQGNKAIGLTPHCILVRRDGFESLSKTPPPRYMTGEVASQVR